MQQQLWLQLGSTNAALHLPALANEIEVKFDLMDELQKYLKKLLILLT